ncbi:MAG: hypothetical protein ACK5L3_04385 [Oscillospiraceae bacterium]
MNTANTPETLGGGAPQQPTPQNPPASSPPASSPPGQPQQAPPQRVRRVGTFSMALSLIATGVFLVLRVFIPNFNFPLVLKLAPVVLVFLGLEILVANFTPGLQKLKYDVLSVFVCLILIGASLLFAFIPDWVTRQDMAGSTGRSLTLAMDNAAYEALKGRGDITRVQSYLNIDPQDYTAGLQLGTLQPQHYIQARVYFSGNAEDKEAFITASREVLATLQTVVPHLDYVSFYSVPDENGAAPERYSLWLDGPFELGWSREQMLANTQTDVWNQEQQSYETQFEITIEAAAYAPGSATALLPA